MNFPSGLSPAAIALFGVLIILQFSLMGLCLAILFKLPESRIRFGRRWIWLIIIVLGELIGPIVFLALGRLPAEAEGAARDTAGNSSALDRLYGSKKG